MENIILTILSLVPWIVGAISVIAIGIFLKYFDSWNVKVPWQIRSYARFLLIIIFIYLLQMIAVVYIPEPRIELFLQGLSLSGDLIKTLVGAIIGATSMSMKGDSDLDSIPDAEDTSADLIRTSLLKENKNNDIK